MKPKTLEEFIREANAIHNDKYTYYEYIGANKKIQIACPKHGIFNQRASAHLSGQGCRECAIEKMFKVK